jgi:pyruvate-ferredoxin/flavodoxin oxidoreductase
LPATVQTLVVLDRCKEPGSTGEPLLQEIASAFVDVIARGLRSGMPRIIGGRYGLGGKEFTPAMVRAALDEASFPAPRTRFTLGIRDDVSDSSLTCDPDFDLEPDDVRRAVFYGLGSDGTVSANKASIRIIGEHGFGGSGETFVQGHFEYDSRKAGSTTVSYLRFGSRPIRATYRVRRAQFVAVHDASLIERRDVFDVAMPGTKVLINTSVPPERIFNSVPREAQEQFIERRCRCSPLTGMR